jgi:hypothetical protein
MFNSSLIYHVMNGIAIVMMYNATFNNILVISRWSVLFVEETGENHRPDKLYHNVV